VTGKGIKNCVQQIGHPPVPRNAEKNSNRIVTEPGEEFASSFENKQLLPGSLAAIIDYLHVVQLVKTKCQ